MLYVASNADNPKDELQVKQKSGRQDFKYLETALIKFWTFDNTRDNEDSGSIFLIQKVGQLILIMLIFIGKPYCYHWVICN